MSKGRAKKKQRRRARAAAGGGGGSAPAGPQERAAARARQREDAPASAAAAAPRRPSRLDVRAGVPRPDAVWAPVPLTEIGMAVGLALFAIGFAGGRAGILLAGLGILVIVVAELCLREHFAGFRSHSLLLGLLPVSAVHLGVVYLGGVTWRGPLALAFDLVIAGALAWWLQRRFVAAQAGARRSSP